MNPENRVATENTQQKSEFGHRERGRVHLKNRHVKRGTAEQKETINMMRRKGMTIVGFLDLEEGIPTAGTGVVGPKDGW